jgi:hypothetical protein
MTTVELLAKMDEVADQAEQANRQAREVQARQEHPAGGAFRPGDGVAAWDA